MEDFRDVGRQGGQADDELAALVGAVAVRLDAAAVHLDQPAHQRQADAQPALRAVERAVDLGEQVEDARQHLGGMPMPVSRTRMTASSSSALHREGDRAAFLGVLGGVVEQVAEHLGQPHRVAVDAQRLARQRDGQLVPFGSISGRLVSTAAR